MQHWFRQAGVLAGGATLFASLLILSGEMRERYVWGEGDTGTARLAPFQFGGTLPEGWSAGGAWRIYDAERRVAGLSALDFDGDELLAASDRGFLLRFDPPAARQQRIALAVEELPSSSGRRREDVEALAVDGDGLWLSLEQDVRVERRVSGLALDRRVDLPAPPWRNFGAEGLVVDDDGFFAFAEGGTRVFDADGGEFALEGSPGHVTGAALVGERILLLHRTLGLTGFGARLSEVELVGSRFRTVRSARIPVGPLDNAEGLAARRLGDGQLELWIVTDDNERRPQRAIVARYVVDAKAWPAIGP